MSIIEAIILGIVQGLTEFIPVSSSGHLLLTHHLLGVEQYALGFDVALHIGTLAALILYFHKDIASLALGIFGKNDQKRLAWLLVFATLPAIIGGFLLQDLAESSFRSPILVSVNLMWVAVLMLLAEKYAKSRQHKTALRDVNAKQAGLIGLAQVIALVPGVSRSGSTITAGIFAGLDRVSATRFSFLLALPITFGAIVKVVLDPSTISQVNAEPMIFVVGIVSAFASGLIAIRFLLRYLSKHTLAVFAYYRIALGILILVLLQI